MGNLKITSWNIENLDRLTGDNLDQNKKKRLEASGQEIEEMSPDILCILEGPKGKATIDKFVNEAFSGKYSVVKDIDNTYDTKGTQWIWFLVKDNLKDMASLLPTETWDNFTESSWKVNYWGDFTTSRHSHYRHPQVMILDWDGTRVEFIGLHLKSKLVFGGKSEWNVGGKRKEEFITDAIKPRIKMTTEAINVRNYINTKFNQTEKPAIFVLGDLNDGPGKEYFERQYLFFDLLSNIQGDVFFANKFLNHALFDYPEHLRWSVQFKDFIDPERNPKILLDHILFTQGLVDESLPLVVKHHAGFVDHEIHDLINANLTSKQKTSDQNPVSLNVTT